jgi:hypothetical protein
MDNMSKKIATQIWTGYPLAIGSTPGQDNSKEHQHVLMA